jgi:hypothetical protein
MSVTNLKQSSRARAESFMAQTESPPRRMKLSSVLMVLEGTSRTVDQRAASSLSMSVIEPGFSVARVTA